MSWSSVDPDLRKIIERVCTPKQIEALKLKADGFGLQRIAQVLGITKESVRSRLDSAALRIRTEAAAMRGADNGRH
jgi:DNA-binding CsgD family transcriptional regulator